MKINSAFKFLALAPICFGLTACEKLQGINSSLNADSANGERVKELSIELSQLKAKVVVLENMQDKENANLEARLKELEKPASTLATNSFPADAIPALKTAIASCVNQVHSTKEAKAEQSSQSNGSFWSGFDAYYNPGNNSVQNNNLYNGGMPAVYFFNKCMVSQGFPLS